MAGLTADLPYAAIYVFLWLSGSAQAPVEVPGQTPSLAAAHLLILAILEPPRQQDEDLVVVKPQLSADPRPVRFGHSVPGQVNTLVDRVDVGGLRAEPQCPPLVELTAGGDRVDAEVLVGQARPTRAERLLLRSVLLIVDDEAGAEGLLLSCGR